MSFLKIFISGLLLVFCHNGLAVMTTPDSSFIDNHNGTVTHKLTGLMWQRCSVGQLWDGVTCTGNVQVQSWDTVINPPVSFAGNGDWRLPTVAELQTLVERDNSNYSGSAFNPRIFPNQPAFFFRTSSPSKNGFPWHVEFAFGFTLFDNCFNYDLANCTDAVRLVRGGTKFDPAQDEYTPAAAFTDHGDGTVTHNLTGLTWQRCAAGQAWTGSTCAGNASLHDFEQAIALKSNFAGKNDWRLPSTNELTTIVEYQALDPAINSTVFLNPPKAGHYGSYAFEAAFWASSLYYENVYPGEDYHWIVSFYNGSVQYQPDTVQHYVRLVRGEWLPFSNLLALAELSPVSLKLQNGVYTSLETTAKFNGGISLNSSSYQRFLTKPANQGDTLTVIGTIIPDDDHVGQLADIVAVGASQTVDPNEAIAAPDDCNLKNGTWMWYMNTKRDNYYCNWSELPGQERYCNLPKSSSQQTYWQNYWQSWRGNLYELQALDQVTLEKSTRIDLTVEGMGPLYKDTIDYHNKHVCINFGYRLKDGTIVFNGDTLNFRTD